MLNFIWRCDQLWIKSSRSNTFLRCITGFDKWYAILYNSKYPRFKSFWKSIYVWRKLLNIFLDVKSVSCCNVILKSTIALLDGHREMPDATNLSHLFLTKEIFSELNWVFHLPIGCPSLWSLENVKIHYIFSRLHSSLEMPPSYLYRRWLKGIH